MKTYDERTKYILEQRNIRLAKQRKIRSAVTASGITACSLAFVIGTASVVARIRNTDGAYYSADELGSSSQMCYDSASAGYSPDQARREIAQDICVVDAEYRVQTDLPSEKIYDWSENSNIEKLDFTMGEFPSDSFTFSAEDNAVYANGGKLYGGMPINSVYLADLNGDGRREIVSEVCFGSGIIDSRIIACDYKHHTLYQLADRGEKDYRITYYEEQIAYDYRLYGSTCGVADGYGDLTLDIMTKISINAPDIDAFKLSGYTRTVNQADYVRYTADDAFVTVEFSDKDFATDLSDKNAARAYSVALRTEWLETCDDNGDTVAMFKINGTYIRVVFNDRAEEKSGDIIHMAIDAFNTSTVRY